MEPPSFLSLEPKSNMIPCQTKLFHDEIKIVAKRAPHRNLAVVASPQGNKRANDENSSSKLKSMMKQFFSGRTSSTPTLQSPSSPPRFQKRKASLPSYPSPPVSPPHIWAIKYQTVIEEDETVGSFSCNPPLLLHTSPDINIPIRRGSIGSSANATSSISLPPRQNSLGYVPPERPLLHQRKRSIAEARSSVLVPSNSTRLPDFDDLISVGGQFDNHVVRINTSPVF